MHRASRSRPTHAVVLVALVAGLLLQGSAPARVAAAATPVADDEFTLVAVPDTQKYTRTAAENVLFTQQMQWIADSRDAMNTEFVTHLGDIVEHESTEVEWQRASANLAILDQAGLRVGIAPGNHDLVPSTGTAARYDTYFPPSRYADDPGYGGYLGPGQPYVLPTDPQRWNKDNFTTFTVAGMDFIVIEFEYGMPDYAVAWADRVLDAYPDHRAILSTHAFLTQSGTRATSYSPTRIDSTTPANVWTQLINTHCNVFLVVSGHEHAGNTLTSGEARRTDTNSCGKPVHQVMSDYQERGAGANGEGRLRYYVFDPGDDQIRAYTYNPVDDTYETDASSQFTLSYDMVGGTPPAPTVPGAPGGVTATAGNASATVSWSAPGSNGGSAVTGYVVTPYVGATAQTATLVGNVTSTSIGGLTNGTAYTFRVAATNVVGTGAPSSASSAVTPSAPPAAGTWVDAWSRSPLSTTVKTTTTSVQATVPSQIRNQTLRTIVWTTVGGSQVRVKLTNQFSTSSLVVAAARVARRSSGGTITSGTDRVLTFGGKTSVTIAAGAEVWSDPVTLTVPARTDLAVSLYLSGTFTPKTFHPTGLKTSYLSRTGNYTGSSTMTAPSGTATKTTTQVLFVSEVQVLPSRAARTVVALGDSNTDGSCVTKDINGTWPDLLSNRLPALADGTPVSVINAGIGSNRFVSSDGAGLSGLKRLPELLARPGVEWVIVMEGINDIAYDKATAAQIIAGYQDAIAKAHAAGVRIMAMPLTQIKGSSKDSTANEATRQAVNAWIRTSGAFDRVIDIEPVLASSTDALRLKSSLTCDAVHPNAAGHAAIANAIDLSIFEE